MSTISSISETSLGSQLSSKASQDIMGKDDFLKLMVAQLQYQDPMEPMANEEFVLQLTQLSTMEQLQNVSDSMETMSDVSRLTNAASMIGKEVTYMNDQAQPVTAVVDGVQMVNGEAVLAIGDLLLSMDAVQSVAVPQTTTVPDGEVTENLG